MHCISVIGFLIIINICRAQPSTFKHLETENGNKGGTFQTGSGGNNPSISVPKSAEEGTIHVNTHNVPSGNSVRYEKDGQNTGKQFFNSGNNNYGYIILPFIIAVTMTMIHF